MNRLEPTYPAPDSGAYQYMRERHYLGPHWWATEYRHLAREHHKSARRYFRLGMKALGKDEARHALVNWQMMRKELEKIEKGYW